MEYPHENWPGIVPAEDYVGTCACEWMDSETFKKLKFHTKRPNVLFDFRIFSGNKSALRRGFSVRAGRTEAIMYQWPI